MISITFHPSYVHNLSLNSSNSNFTLISYQSLNDWEQIYPLLVVIVEIDRFHYSNILRIAIISFRVWKFCTNSLTIIYPYPAPHRILGISVLVKRPIPFSIVCSTFLIINQVKVLFLASFLLDDSIYNIHWFYPLLIIYLQFCYYVNRIFNDIIYLWFYYQYEWFNEIWTMKRYYQHR